MISTPVHQQQQQPKERGKPSVTSPSTAPLDGVGADVSGLPGPLATWEQQNKTRSTASSKADQNRRILPLPGGQRRDSNESETARHVRLLLARHQQQHHQLKQLQRQGVAMNQTPFLVDGVQSDSNGSDDQFSSALPGDSYPDTDRHLASTEVDSNITDDEEVILMQRLSQSQARMEQIKRMLVNQRGFIVQALRLMAEGGRSGAPGQASSDHSNADPDERDRTLGSSVKHVAERLDPDVQDLESESSEVSHKNEKKLCPMCEAAFPTDVDEDEFELHVIEHFNYDEQDTLKYVGPDEGEVISQ